MISKFSVKKPYTVIVAVVLVIILGVVSFTKMSTDLLPSMDLPYAIVMTTYPGASTETVEQTVTKPIEQSMATVSNIKNVSSMSSENASVVILEFGESTNMDSVTLEMRENLDQIKGYWDDSVGNPIIMKLNPDMMPVLVAAADVDGMSAAEVTDYIENNVQSELESIDGVARISVSGNVTESIQVQISQEKLDAVNQKVQDAINGQFEEKEQDVIAGIHRAVEPDFLELESDLALIAVVGRGMRSNRGTAGRIFSALAHARVNVKMIDQGSSEWNIIIGVKNADFETAIKAIYDIFITVDL